MKARRTLTLAVVTAAFLAGTAVPAAAAAATDYSTGLVTYNCTFPGVGVQPVTAVAGFGGPDAVAAGSPIAVENFSGGMAVSPDLYKLMAVYLGYDGVRGSGTLPIAAENALPGTANVGVTIPEVFWDPLNRAFYFQHPGPVASFTAGSPGSAAFRWGSPFTLAIEFHFKGNNTWRPWTMNCALRVSSPPQNPYFSPSLPVD